ncbi:MULTISPECIES: ABC transporter ATP-binding protein [Vibrio]|uniref:ABC-type dipeptide transporter n=1 Tax=Vibrio algicola TaxID=2662262 RepID=A0A5Q0TES9_9VIBR|nr:MULTISPECIES: ABC transporter ATP-binding protein [Vibrio]MBD1575122.1 ABC transporter ATP-binding protein [Vibrio sp. S11_S32]
MTNQSVLTINDLCTEFTTDDGVVRVLDGVSFDVPKGKTLGIVGESGCGKSVTAMSIMGLLPKPFGQVVAGCIVYSNHDAGAPSDVDLLQLPVEQMYRMRGNRISMIFQDPMTALNPVHTIGKQLIEVLQLHRSELNKKQRYLAALEMLEKVGIPSAKQRMLEFPHLLSGGMRQRVMIAMALACRPDVLICDEPTTALDVTVQAQILDLMQELQAETGMSIIFITHDLGVVAEICDQVVVMYAGKVVEQADIFELFDHPSHPYTQGLLTSMPSINGVPKSLLPTIEGSVPALSNMPTGCRFASRCQYAQALCHQSEPELSSVSEPKVSELHLVSCHFWSQLDSLSQSGTVTSANPSLTGEKHV